MLDRAYFEERQRVLQAAQKAERERIDQIQAELVDLRVSGLPFEIRVAEAQYEDAWRQYREVCGRADEIQQALWAFDGIQVSGPGQRGVK